MNLSYVLSDEDNETGSQDVYTRAQILWGQFELVFFILGTPANLGVIFICLRILRGSRNTNNNQYFVLSMAVADLIATSVHSPIVFIHYGLERDIGDSGCWILYLATYFSWISSSLSLVCLNLDKCLYLARPLHYRMFARKKYVFIAVALSWAIALFLTFVYIFLGTTLQSESCVFIPRHKEFYIAVFIISFVIPVLVSCIVSISIAFIVINFNRNIPKRSVPSSSVTSLHPTVHPARLIRSLFFVFSTTIWTALTTLPYRIAYIITMSLSRSSITDTTVFIIFGLLILLGLNSVGNPFISVCTQTLYRKQIKEILRISRGGGNHTNVTAIHKMNSYRSSERFRTQKPDGCRMSTKGVPRDLLSVDDAIRRGLPQPERLIIRF